MWKRKSVDISISEELEFIKNLVSGVSVIRVCDEYGVTKQTVCDIRHRRCQPSQAPALLKKPPAVLHMTFLVFLTQSNTHFVSPMYSHGRRNYSPLHKVV